MTHTKYDEFITTKSKKAQEYGFEPYEITAPTKPLMAGCQQEPCSASFAVGTPVIVVFGGGMSGTMMGTVIAPNTTGYVEVEATQEWEDGDSGTIYPVGRKFLCHPHEVSLQNAKLSHEEGGKEQR